MTRPQKILLYSGLGLVGLLVVAAIAAVLVLRSPWFHEKVRQRIVSEIEKDTGGRVELGSYSLDWRNLRATVNGLVLHGKESSEQAPLFRAASITVGLNIVSLWDRDVNVALIAVKQPEVHIYVAPDGSTNLPAPKVPSTGNRNIVQTLFALKVGEFSLTDGVLEYASRKIPIDVRGHDLNARFAYEPAGPRYLGTISSRQVQVASSRIQPLAFDFDTSLAVEKNRVQVASAHLGLKQSSLDVSGQLVDFSAPQAGLNVKASLSLAELARPLKLPVAAQGELEFQGNVSALLSTLDYTIAGTASGNGLGYSSGQIHLSGLAIHTSVQSTPARTTLSGLSASVLGARFSGHATLEELSRFQASGTLTNASIGSVALVVLPRPLPWAGIASGPVKLSGEFAKSGVRRFQLDSSLTVVPGPGGIPVQGAIEASYDQAAGALRFGDSHIATPSSSLEISGTLGETMRVKAQSSDLNDVLPAITAVSSQPAKPLPVTLRGGSASFDGTVQGPLKTPTINGQATMTKFRIHGVDIDRVSADFELSSSAVALRTLTVQQGSTRMTGKGRAGLVDWQLVDASAVTASLNIQDAQIEPLLAEAGYKAPLSGVASVNVTLSGSYGSPQATVQVRADRVVAYGEKLGSVQTRIRYAANSVDLTSLRFSLAQSSIEISGAYRYSGNWKNGQIQFQAAAPHLDLAKVNTLAKARPGLEGTLDLDAAGSARLAGGTFIPEKIDGHLGVQNFSLDGQSVGSLQLAAATNDGMLRVTANGDVRKTKISGSGSVRLSGDYQSEAKVQFAETTFDTLHRLIAASRTPLPFEGSVEGSATLAGPLRKPEELRGELTIAKVELRPRPGQQLRFAEHANDLVLKSAEPVVLRLNSRRVQIVSARFTAMDTNLEAVGHLAFDSQSPWNLRLHGGINLAVLQIFDPSLLGKGNATVNATVRGSLSAPDVSGRMQLQNASLYLSDLTNGIDDANGVILFDQNRATIQSLTAELGGGKISLTGFVGFGGAGAPLLYRLQGKADNIRIRRPEGVSVGLDASVGLTGTSESSFVSGTVTVVRASFNPRTDVGALLAQSTQPAPAPHTPNEYLRGMQLDVRIESSPGFELQTSLTRNIQSDIDLRLRGTPAHPILLGEVSVNEGEVEIFGNKYQINRGEIRFFNPVKIEPSFDMDLETKARGIDVNISFSGTLSHLNVTYRSDPPLQSSQIIALLAVGREPNASMAMAQSQVAAQSSFLQTGANTLLGAALSSQVSGRLQRLFGISRVKIDPELTGVENIPQARLTLEQQVSKNITVTYITNLTRTDEQIVQIQWDLNKRWSAVAIRDENGVFGVDFQYRRRFK